MFVGNEKEPRLCQLRVIVASGFKIEYVKLSLKISCSRFIVRQYWRQTLFLCLKKLMLFVRYLFDYSNAHFLISK